MKNEKPTLDKVPREVSNHVKNKKSTLDKVLRKTTAAKKRVSARLRKMRWLIYKFIPSQMRRARKILRRYKKLVNKFLNEFS